MAKALASSWLSPAAALNERKTQRNGSSLASIGSFPGAKVNDLLARGRIGRIPLGSLRPPATVPFRQRARPWPREIVLSTLAQVSPAHAFSVGDARGT
jgi:hypothetical protein